MGLSNFQLVLLDDLIYLDETTRVRDNWNTVGKVVHKLLYADGIFYKKVCDICTWNYDLHLKTNDLKFKKESGQ